MKEKILEAFKALGFEMEELEDFGYGFNFEGKKFLYMLSENDEEFLNIALPAVWDDEDESSISSQELIEDINSTLKYVKAYKMMDSVWIVYERALLDDDDLKLIIAHMVIHLDRALAYLRHKVAEAEKDDDEPEDSETTDGQNDTDEE